MSDFLSLNTIGELSVVLRGSSFFFSGNLFKGKSENQIESNPVYSPSSTFPCLSFLPASLLSCVVAWAAFRRPERLSCFTNPSSVSFDFSLCPLSVTRWQPRGPPPPSPPRLYCAYFHLLANTGTSAYLGRRFLSMFWISNALCGLTCFHQRRWHWFNPLTPTIFHPWLNGTESRVPPPGNVKKALYYSRYKLCSQASLAFRWELRVSRWNSTKPKMLTRLTPSVKLSECRQPD